MLAPTCGADAGGALKNYYKDFICIKDVAAANYRPEEIGGKKTIQRFYQRSGRNLRMMIIIICPHSVVHSASSGLSCGQRETNQRGV